jgi:lambda repressor-like predicted transcriptional regulator
MGLSTDIQAILSTAAVVQQVITQGINSDGSLKPGVIRALLKLKGINVRALAKANGYTDPQFHQVINGEYQDSKVQGIIATALGIKVSNLWGPSSESVA